MEIEKFTETPELKRGRPIIYPFDKIKPGEKLTIPVTGVLKDRRVSVSNSLNYYKKINGLSWSSVVMIEGNNIVVYRLN